MVIQVKNTQYFEWEVPTKLIKQLDTTEPTKVQQLIDEHFNPDNDVTVEQISDDYYELEDIIND